MNVLIRNVDKETKWNEVVGILDLLTTHDEFIKELDIKKTIIFNDSRLNLTKPIKVSQQDNGNLCVEFKGESK